MMMTELEIVSTFRQAKYPGKQVEILAQLNGCTTEEIKEILLRNGVEQKNLPRKSRKMRQAEMDALVRESAVETKEVPVEVPVEVQPTLIVPDALDLVREQEAVIELEYSELCAQVEELSARMTKAAMRLNDIRTAREALERVYEGDRNENSECN